jgi:hypothetical protein
MFIFPNDPQTYPQLLWITIIPISQQTLNDDNLEMKLKPLAK